MVVAIALVLLVVGSVLFHVLSPWYFTPIASNWGTIDDTVTITFWVTGIVFVAVNLFMAWCVLRYRAPEGTARRMYEPENKKLEGWLIVLTSVGVGGDARARPRSSGRSSSTSRRTRRWSRSLGRQWNWSYRFPGSGRRARHRRCAVRQRQESVRHQSGRSARAGRRPDREPGAASADRQAVKALLRSIDVLHDFTVPQFRVKMDMVPGLVTYVWFTPTRAGTYDVLCEELCGIAHFAMRGKVVVEEEAAFKTWLAGYPTFAQTYGARSPAMPRRGSRSMRCAPPAMARRGRAIPRSTRRN